MNAIRSRVNLKAINSQNSTLYDSSDNQIVVSLPEVWAWHSKPKLFYTTRQASRYPTQPVQPFPFFTVEFMGSKLILIFHLNNMKDYKTGSRSPAFCSTSS